MEEYLKNIRVGTWKIEIYNVACSSFLITIVLCYSIKQREKEYALDSIKLAVR
jgi:hypothetical protein